MDKYPDNSIFQYLLVMCFSLALILSQTSRLHMHFQHDDHSSVTSAHIVDVHTISTLHNFDLIDQHEDHHSAAIDINSDNLIKKTNLLNPLLLIILFIGIFLYIPRFACLSRHKLYKTLFISCSYLLQPPPRAPPL